MNLRDRKRAFWNLTICTSRCLTYCTTTIPHTSNPRSSRISHSATPLLLFPPCHPKVNYSSIIFFTSDYFGNLANTIPTIEVLWFQPWIRICSQIFSFFVNIWVLVQLINRPTRTNNQLYKNQNFAKLVTSYIRLWFWNPAKFQIRIRKKWNHNISNFL